MRALVQELKARYPILSEVQLSATSDAPPEPIPPFLGLLLALAESDDKRGCCLVLPDPTGIAPVFATLMALVRLRKEFEGLTRAYATRGIARDQLVKVNPSGHVYVYDGVFEDMPHLFKLRELDTVDDARSLPVTEVLRLEPTERKRPKGKLNTDLRHHAHPPLDLLLGIESWGNESLYQNRVLFLSSQSGFERFLENTRASSSGSPRRRVSGILSEIIPWGSVDDAGGLVSADAYQVAGEPLIAVTHSIDHLAVACSTHEHSTGESISNALLSGFATGECVVVAEGTSRILRNLQAFDDVEEARKVIVIAGPEERDALAILEQRGLNVWHVLPEEVLAGSSSHANLSLETDENISLGDNPSDHEGGDYCGPTIFRSLLSCAQNQSVFDLQCTVCVDERLDLAADALVLAADSIEEQEGEDAALRGIRSLFNLLFRLAERVGPLGDDDRQPFIVRLEDAVRRIESRALWLPEDTIALTRDAADALVEALHDPAFGRHKAKALADLLSPEEKISHAARRTATVIRYSSSREHVHRLIRELGRTATVCTDRLLPRGESFDDIAVLSWPGSARFGSLVRRYPAPRLSLIAYPFEKDWMRQFRRRMDQETRQSNLTRSLKAEILGLPLELLPLPDESEPASKVDPDPPLSIFRVEGRVLRRRKGCEHTGDSGKDTVEARYLGFVGDTYAYLREGSALPVVTGLVQSAVDGVGSRSKIVPKRTASDLREGDFVLFREGSDHDVVRLFAEVIAGAEAYEDLRSQAISWRPCLQACAPDAKHIHGRLREAGLARSPVTVRNWLYDEEQIGPQDQEDLVVIADVAGLDYPVEEVWTAIEAVRGLHRAAGHKISEWLLQGVPQHVQRLLEGEARLDLDFGAFYVVEVEEIAPQPERVPSGIANELRWDTL